MVVGLKRFWIALNFDRQTFTRYARDLKDVMEKAIMIGEVATLSREMERITSSGSTSTSDAYKRTVDRYNRDEGSVDERASAARQSLDKNGGRNSCWYGFDWIGTVTGSMSSWETGRSPRRKEQQ